MIHRGKKSTSYYLRERWALHPAPGCAKFTWRRLIGEYRSLAAAKKAAERHNAEAGKGNVLQVCRVAWSVVGEVRS